MSFHEKSNLLMGGIMLAVYAGYVVSVLLAGETTLESLNLIIFISVVAIAVVAAIGHGVIAALAPKEADGVDERDKLIELRGEKWGSMILTVGVLATMLLALTGSDMVRVVNTLFASLVLSEIVKAVSKAIYYRGGV